MLNLCLTISSSVFVLLSTTELLGLQLYCMRLLQEQCLCEGVGTVELGEVTHQVNELMNLFQ